MERKILVKAWKLDSFMYALVGYGIDLDAMEMKKTKSMNRFMWLKNGEVVATYDERKEHGFVNEKFIKPLYHMVCGTIFSFPY